MFYNYNEHFSHYFCFSATSSGPTVTYRNKQSTVGLRSPLAVLFQIQISVCIVSLLSMKDPPSHSNCSFWKLLLGDRPVWKWNRLCIVFPQLYSSDITTNLLCLWYNSTVRLPSFACVWICSLQCGCVCFIQSCNIKPILFSNPFSATSLHLCGDSEISILRSHLWVPDSRHLRLCTKNR